LTAGLVAGLGLEAVARAAGLELLAFEPAVLRAVGLVELAAELAGQAVASAAGLLASGLAGLLVVELAALARAERVFVRLAWHRPKFA